MREYAIFQILSETTPRVPYSPQVGCDTYSQLAKIAYEGGISRKTPERTGSMIQIKALLPNAALRRVIDMLRAAGWSPVYGPVSHDSEGCYPIRRVREYSQEDLDAAEFLYIASVWGEWPITGFVGRDAQRWIGDVDRVGIHSGLGWTQRIGYVDGAYNYFVADCVRDGMRHRELRGLCFHRLEWNEPARAQGRFWEVDSTVLMPPCSLPVVDMDGSYFYEEDGYDPVELRFGGSEVQALGSFDVAWCREQIGDLTKSNWGSHVLVISQKFRQAVKDLGLADLVTLYPVRLGE